MAVDHLNPEKDTLKGDLKKGAAIEHGSGGKIPYPKHVWSPAGGWYSQPKNWKGNTAIMGGVLFGIVALVWNVSARGEYRNKMPEKGRFFPSRNWTKQIREKEAREGL